MWVDYGSNANLDYNYQEEFTLSHAAGFLQCGNWSIYLLLQFSRSLTWIHLSQFSLQWTEPQPDTSQKKSSSTSMALLDVYWLLIYNYILHIQYTRVQELCESRGGCPGFSVLTSLMVSLDVKQYWTILMHWSQLVPNMSTDIRGHQATQQQRYTDSYRHLLYSELKSGWYLQHLHKMENPLV